jgi:3-deoxy-D-manno-octulosonic-acid transferase
MKPIRAGLLLRAKARLFRLLEALSDLRGNNTHGQLELPRPASPHPAAWVFVSTIGELNAIEPWLRELESRVAPAPLLLITDHDHYRASYEARYPRAVVCVSRGHGSDAAMIARHYPPTLLVVAEIPALPLDAPCRFASAFVLEAKRHGAPALLVNGWLYGYAPACTMDRIERRLFERDYLRCFDRLCVQTEAVAERLRAAGAAPERIAVCGNIKFDAMARSDWTPAHAHSPRLLQALLDTGRPIIVAGCVTSEAEQTLVLEAFGQVRQRHPAALLVLAPRHPEVLERMQALRALLAQRGWSAAWRSALADADLPAGSDCLVLDTMGDLRDFYAAATIAHVGVDHNVLEPLGFERPVTVLPGWEPSYPSYPVFEILKSCGALRLAEDAQALAAHWLGLLDAGPGADAERLAQARAALARAKGAVARHFNALEPWV